MHNLKTPLRSFLLAALLLGYSALQAQEPAKFTPIVHVFANAEFNPTNGVSKDYSFWIGRMMAGGSYAFDKHWSAKVLIDRTRLEGSINTMYLKLAHLRWAPTERIAIEAGTVFINSYIPWEIFYGYRFVAETFQDRYYGIPSSDIGVIGYFKLSDAFRLDLALTNGDGPRLDQDAFGKLKFAGGLSYSPNGRFQARVYSHIKESGAAGALPEQLITGYAGYSAGERIRLGVEYSYINRYQNIPGYVTYGSSAFVIITLVKSLKLLARFDDLFYRVPEGMPDLKPVSGNAYISGISFSPIKNITLCLNYQGFISDWNVNPDSHRFLFSFEYRI